MNDFHWDALKALAATGSMVVAFLALTISWLVWRRSSSGEITSQIKKGDAELSDQISKISEDLSAHRLQQENRITALETSHKHAISKEDIQHLHNRISYLIRDMGAAVATISAVTSRIDRLDDFSRKQQ